MYKYHIIVFTIIITLMTIFTGCGDGLSRGKAEDIILAQKNRWGPKTQEIKIVDGDYIAVDEGLSFGMIPRVLTKHHDDINNVYRLFKYKGYIDINRLNEKNKKQRTGEKFLTDIYSIHATDKLQPFITTTIKEKGTYGVYPAGQSQWTRKNIEFNIHVLSMKIYDKEFVQIDSIRDTRENKSGFGYDCDAIVKYTYRKTYTDIGEVLIKQPSKDILALPSEKNVTMDGLYSEEDCFRLFDDGWKLAAPLDSEEYLGPDPEQKERKYNLEKDSLSQDKKYRKLIVGKWLWNETHDGIELDVEATFLEDGTATLKGYAKKGRQKNDVNEEYEWEIKDGYLIQKKNVSHQVPQDKGEKEEDVTDKIMSLTTDELILFDKGEFYKLTQSYNRK